MIVWGSGGDTVLCGTLGHELCPVCERERPQDLLLSYRYWGLYWVFNMVTKKEYYIACRVCQHGAALDTKLVERDLVTRSPIPFTRRFGLALLAGGFTLVTLFAAVAGA